MMVKRSSTCPLCGRRYSFVINTLAGFDKQPELCPECIEIDSLSDLNTEQQLALAAQARQELEEELAEEYGDWEALQSYAWPSVYQRRCKRTVYGELDGPLELFTMATLGVTGELAEFADSRTPVELGDVEWYISALFEAAGAGRLLVRDHAKHATIHFLEGREAGPLKHARDLAADLCELCKKARYHGLDWEGTADLCALASGLDVAMAIVCEQLDWDRRDIWALNLAKLQDRYPKGFEKLEGK